jgi:hypothetical protein
MNGTTRKIFGIKFGKKRWTNLDSIYFSLTTTY